MKRWALLTLALYLVALLVVLIPVLCFLAGEWDISLETGVWKTFSCFVAVMIVGQALLLLVPVGISKERPRARRRLLVPAITSAFMLSALVICVLVSILVAIWGDNGPPNMIYPFEPKGLGIWVTIICFIWLIWSLIFHRFSANRDPEHAIGRLMRWLLAGSILELLVAIPSHVIVRRSEDCCAPGVTMFGITTGIAIMLLSFGPGVFFLFARRFKQLRGWREEPMPIQKKHKDILT